MRKVVKPAAAEPTAAEPADAAAAVAPAATHRIAALPAAGFCRAGRRWSREGEEANRADFDGAQWAALTGEPLLSVVAL